MSNKTIAQFDQVSKACYVKAKLIEAVRKDLMERGRLQPNMNPYDQAKAEFERRVRLGVILDPIGLLDLPEQEVANV